MHVCVCGGGGGGGSVYLCLCAYIMHVFKCYIVG